MKNLLLAAFLFCCSFSFAQIIFEKGYFISNTGTRTECYIKNIDWRDNPTGFTYKTQLEDTESKNETIANVMEFGIDNTSKFRKFKINMDRSGNNMNDLSKSKNPVWKEETLFLRLLVEGDATLYSYTEGNLIRYFYETKNIPAEQLVHIKYMSQDKNQGVDSYSDSVKENNQFRQQLYSNIRCSATTENDFKNLKYEKSSLMKIFTKYNSCGTNTAIKYEAKNEQNPFAIKATVSVNRASLSISDPHTYYNLNTDIEAKTVFKAGIEIEYILPFNKNKWSIFVNPMYQKYEAEKTYVNNDGFNSNSVDVTHKVTVEYSSVEVSTGVRHYMFLNKSSKLFINAAYVLDLGAKAKFNFNDDPYRQFESDTRNNFAFGLGYNFKNRFSVELRANSSMELLSYYVTWSAKYSSAGIIFGYRFL